MSRQRGLKPGTKAPKSGQYQVIGPRGGKGNKVTSVKGESLPINLGAKRKGIKRGETISTANNRSNSKEDLNARQKTIGS